jgi:hypothetical protein
MTGVNWLAALLAGFAGFAVGAAWYSPVLFAKLWQREAKLTDEDLAKGSPLVPMAGALVLSIISAIVFAMFLGESPGVRFATLAGFAAGLFWVGASFGISYLFERRSLAHFLVNAGYHTLQFTTIGLVLGLMS